MHRKFLFVLTGYAESHTGFRFIVGQVRHLQTGDLRSLVPSHSQSPLLTRPESCCLKRSATILGHSNVRIVCTCVLVCFILPTISDSHLTAQLRHFWRIKIAFRNYGRFLIVDQAQLCCVFSSSNLVIASLNFPLIPPDDLQRDGHHLLYMNTTNHGLRLRCEEQATD